MAATSLQVALLSFLAGGPAVSPPCASSSGLLHPSGRVPLQCTIRPQAHTKCRYHAFPSGRPSLGLSGWGCGPCGLPFPEAGSPRPPFPVGRQPSLAEFWPELTPVSHGELLSWLAGTQSLMPCPRTEGGIWLDVGVVPQTLCLLMTVGAAVNRKSPSLCPLGLGVTNPG